MWWIRRHKVAIKIFGSGYILSVGFILFYDSNYDSSLVESLLFSIVGFIPIGFAFFTLTWLGGEVYKWITKP